MIEGSRFSAIRCRPGPGKEVSDSSTSELPQSRNLRTILPGNDQVLLNGANRPHVRGSGRFPNGDSGLGEVGVPFSLRVALVDLETTEVFILELDGDDRDFLTLSIANSLGLTILSFLTLLGLRIASVKVRGSSGRGRGGRR